MCVISKEWVRIRKESVVAGSTRLNLNKSSIISCKSVSSFYLKFLCINGNTSSGTQFAFNTGVVEHDPSTRSRVCRSLSHRPDYRSQNLKVSAPSLSLGIYLSGHGSQSAVFLKDLGVS